MEVATANIGKRQRCTLGHIFPPVGESGGALPLPCPPHALSWPLCGGG
jgi:hypothetical protein